MANNNKQQIRQRQDRNMYNPVSELFKKLTKLFSGPLVSYRHQTEKTIRSKALNKYASKFYDTSGQSFKKSESNPFENLSLSRMVNHQRALRYSEFSQMEFSPDLASALDVYSEEMTTFSSLEPILKIKCSNEEIREVLHMLYFSILNVEFNLFNWCRGLCKYGDFFMYLDIDEDKGIRNVIGLPTEEIERIEGEDKDNPNYCQFQWNVRGVTFENWQVAHMRILGNDKYAPYGQSVLDPARRVFRQLDLLESAMMAYRIVRSAEKRVFYIDIGNIPPTDVEGHMQKVMTQMKRSQIVDADSGRVDLRYNPLCNHPKSLMYFCDGTLKSIEEISNDLDSYKDKNVWSMNLENNIVPTKLLWVGKTKENAKFIEVTLDDGQILKTTPEHKWKLRDGNLCETKNLQVGNSLMPLYFGVDKGITFRHGSRDNFYIDVYQPGKKKWELAHKVVAHNKYGEYHFPEIIHHKDHIKYNNDPSNLEKMLNVEHGLLHKENIKKLNEYAKSEEGRQKSRETLALTRSKNNNFKEKQSELWKNKKIRQKRVDALSLKVDSTLIMFVCKVINKLGTMAREYEIREGLNSDLEFQQYLRDLNPNFKNGFNDKFTKNQFRYSLRKNNFNNLREVKDFVTSIKAPWDKVVEFSSGCIARKQISQNFNISPYDLNRLIEKHGLTKQQFDIEYLHGGYYNQKEEKECVVCGKKFVIRECEKEQKYCSQECYWSWMRGKNWNEIRINNEEVYLNHTIVAIRECEELEDAYGITVENSTHLVAVCGENVGLIRGKVPKSAIIMHNSIEEDLYIPIRQGSATKIETLPGGQYTGDIDDVKYLRDKLFSAIKIPMSYLSRGDGASDDKASLASKDVRFARTIQRLQRSVISELEKIGIIHLYVLGFRGEDLLSFKLALNNPSKITELQELEHWRTKFDVASAATEGFFSRRWISEKMFNMSDEEFLRNQRELFFDKAQDKKWEEISSIESGGEGGGLGGDLGGDLGGEDETTPEGEGEEDILLAKPEEGGGELPEVGEQPMQEDKDSYLTPNAKGKLYTPETFDKRGMGARKRHMQSMYSHEKSSSAKRNVFGGVEDIMSLARGISENKIQESNYNEEEKQLMKDALEVKVLIESLEKKEFKKSDKS